MTERSYPWGGIVLGDAGPYTDDDWADIWERFLGALADGDTGILSNVANELVVTGAVTPMSVDTGDALVNGTYYNNDAAVSVVIATPGGATRVDRVVLRKTWATQEIRVTLIAGVEGGGAPALTQTDGVTWDMPLFQASITTGGAITLTDERERLFTRTPSMTTAQRDAMSAANGMIIYNETTATLEGRVAGAWVAIPLVQANQAALEAETNEDTYAPPDLLRFGPWSAKAYAHVLGNGTLEAGSYNVTSSSTGATGIYTVTWADDFSAATYTVLATLEDDSGAIIRAQSRAVGTVSIRTLDNSDVLADAGFNVAALGDQ